MSAPWLCEVCGEHDNNRESWERCVVCNRKRGTWLCQRCGKLNRPHDKACRYCGGKREWEVKPGG